jgi:hypothetical protein
MPGVRDAKVGERVSVGLQFVGEGVGVVADSRGEYWEGLGCWEDVGRVLFTRGSSCSIPHTTKVWPMHT